MTDHAATVREALGLMNSMITSRERHSFESTEKFIEGATALAALEQELAEAKQRADGWVQHDTEAYAASSLRALKRADAAETRVKELEAEIEDSGKYVLLHRQKRRAEAAEAALAEAKQRIAYLTAEAHGWQPRLAQAEEALREIAFDGYACTCKRYAIARAALAREDAL